jgi:hypothetical protein
MTRDELREAELVGQVGETSPSSRRSTISSMRVPLGAEAIE